MMGFWDRSGPPEAAATPPTTPLMGEAARTSSWIGEDQIMTAVAAAKDAFKTPPVNGDFYQIADGLNTAERGILARECATAEKTVAPIIEDYWAQDKFPFDIIPKMAALVYSID